MPVAVARVAKTTMMPEKVEWKQKSQKIIKEERKEEPKKGLRVQRRKMVSD